MNHQSVAVHTKRCLQADKETGVLIRTKPAEASVAMIDLTAIIDMVFLLLIFFLVATTFQQTEREMKIALPAASSAGPISAALRELVINVDVEGTIIVAGRTMDAESLRTLITDAVKANPQQKVTVRGDRGTAYANVVRVLDICKGSGVQEPYLDTVMRE
jgi:biopolymer transport protein ExbD